jgi:hypothetical protein
MKAREEVVVGKEEKPSPEDIWADPEAVLRPTEGERLTSLMEEFENERYPLIMALGWINQALERLPQNQTFLKGLLNESRVELAGLTVALNIGMDQARQMISECTGEPATASDPGPADEIAEHQRSQVAEISDDDIESAEDAERNTMRQEWYAEKQATVWIVETLNMLPLERRFSSFRKVLVATRKALLQRMAEIEETVGFDLVMYRES